MNQEELVKKIISKNKLISKHAKELTALKALCTHQDYTQKEKYYDGGYDYYASTKYYKICNVCGARFDESTKQHDWR